MSLKTGGDPRVDMDRTAPNKNYNAKSPAKPTPDPRVEPEESPMPTKFQKRPTLQIEMKIETTAKTTPSKYALVIMYDETGKAICHT